MGIMDIKTSDEVDTEENLINTKPWFNGSKRFSSIKVEPPQESSSDLVINVFDKVNSDEHLGD